MNLHVIGNVLNGSVGTCKVDAVDIALYTDASGAPGSLVYDAKLLLPGDGAGAKTFTWSSNQSTVLSFDIVDLHPGGSPSEVLLDFSTRYWLRVKLLVDFLGDSGTAR